MFCLGLGGGLGTGAIVAFAGCAEVGLVCVGPEQERGGRLEERLAERGERVLHPGRDDRVDGARDQTVTLERAYGDGQHARGDPADLAAQLAEAPGAAADKVDDLQGPLVADAPEHLPAPAAGKLRDTRRRIHGYLQGTQGHRA